jgi:hypothetical protein
MRKLKIMEHISLDGVIQVSDNFPYGDWTAPYRTPAGLEKVLAMYGETYDLLLGRRNCATKQEANWSRSNSCLATFRCKPQSVTWDANNVFAMR